MVIAHITGRKDYKDWIDQRVGLMDLCLGIGEFQPNKKQKYAIRTPFEDSGAKEDSFAVIVGQNKREVKCSRV